MIVEGEGIVFWTWVQIPAIPLNCVEANPRQNAKIAVFRNVFGFIFDINLSNKPKQESEILSFSSIRRWILTEHGVNISNSSISGVLTKCGIARLDDVIYPIESDLIKTSKEKKVLEAINYLAAIRDN